VKAFTFSNKKSNPEHTVERRKLFFFLTYASLGGNILILVSQIFSFDFNIFIVAILLFISYSLTLHCHKFYSENLAYHLYLLGTFVPYNIATAFFTTNLIAPILAFPLLLLLSFYYFDTTKEHVFYLITCFFSEFFFVMGLDRSIVDGIDNSMWVNGGFLFLYTVVTYIMSGIYLGKLREANSILVEKQEFIKKQNIELHKYIEKNMQLESFNYLASHELQTPLNNISNFSDLLSKQLEDKLSHSDQKLFEFILEGTQNMQVLIKSLVKFNDLSSEDLSCSKFIPKELVNDLLYQFNDLIVEENAMIEVADMPSDIFADKPLFKQVIFNLIANAIKFKSTERPLIIKISGYEQNGFWQFSVADNGLGISKEYFDKIFLMFKKLHNKEEYEGLGFGLAFCKKIIEKHNGRIWVDSAANNGSTFHFQLPRNVMKRVA